MKSKNFSPTTGLVTSTGPVVPGQTPSGRDWKAITSSKGRVTDHVSEDEEEIEMSLANSPAWVLAKEQLARLDNTVQVYSIILLAIFSTTKLSLFEVLLN